MIYLFVIWAWLKTGKKIYPCGGLTYIAGLDIQKFRNKCFLLFWYNINVGTRKNKQLTSKLLKLEFDIEQKSSLLKIFKLKDNHG